MFISYINNVLNYVCLIHREIEACSQLMVSLKTFLQYLKILYTWSTEVMSDGKLSLFIMDHSAQEFIHWTENINQYCFYGRCIGFQVFVNNICE